MKKRERKGMKMRMVSFLMVVVSALIIVSGTAFADVYVNGYFRTNGTYVQPHYRSNPDGIISNNWSTFPNVNPYTGKVGTKLNW